MWVVQALSLLATATAVSAVLVPPSKNLALGRHIVASSTCGEANGQPIQELYCTIAGAIPYNPHNKYSYSMVNNSRRVQEFRAEEHSFLQNGQNCDYCKANSYLEHPASNMVDGAQSWWMSPPLSRGMQYHKVNITIDLGQEFHIAYVWVQMANSPRPAAWVLEKSDDFGKTYKPWQYFASTARDCARLFNVSSSLVYSEITEDDQVVCTTDYSAIHPMENGEMMIKLLESRPGQNSFGLSSRLQEFVRATNIRLRFIRANTMYAQLMDYKAPNDPTVTRRYYYAIKEIIMGGRCICNGHASSCSELDPSRRNTLICQCEHNTCGDNCDRCCEGFEQKKWKPSGEVEFVCEQCNCHGHSEECVYDEEIDQQGLSLDIHGKYEGGGKCSNCRDHTTGINCNKCVDGYFKPAGKYWNETDACSPCDCDPAKHTHRCADETGVCECLPQFTGPNCDQCAVGYYHPPECKRCQCLVNGTSDGACLPDGERCQCKENYGGDFCEQCAPGFTNLTAGCVACGCDSDGASSPNCDLETGNCTCKGSFAGKTCSVCAKGYYNYPDCKLCDCDPGGTEEDVCDKGSGQCLCKSGYAGRRCDQCDVNFFGYPNCQPCNCDENGSEAQSCDATSGQCRCKPNFTGSKCSKCAIGFYNYPECNDCACNPTTSKGKACDHDGRCYCKENIEGIKCDRCKPKLYNYPLCEECNCNPNGVVEGFPGCDNVKEGELCSCKENVDGRTCSECKPTFWDLNVRHSTGCVDCNCNMTGVVSLLNTCSARDGSCMCKAFVAGQKCDSCAVGYHSMDGALVNGCEACECDAGGAIGHACNPHNGQCRCRPRVEGVKCDQPIKDHFFPTLHQLKFEAESGKQANGKNVRYAVKTDEFPDYSYRGYAVFSPIQDQIFLDIDIKKASLYRVLVHYRTPIDIFIPLEVQLSPVHTQTQDANFSASINLPAHTEPNSVFVNAEDKPFLLNPGRWQMAISTPKRLFVDYVVLIPSEYYTAAILRTPISEPCPAVEDPNTPCMDYLYPPLKHYTRTAVPNNAENVRTFDEDGAIVKLGKVPSDVLPDSVGEAGLIPARPFTRGLEVELDVPADDDYYLVLEYFNAHNETGFLRTMVEQDGQSAFNEGLVPINKCPFNVLCRELVSKEGEHGRIPLKKSPPKAMAVFKVPPELEFGLASVSLVSAKEWTDDFLKQVPVCVRKDNECIGLQYPIPSNSIVTPVTSGPSANDSVPGDKLPFELQDADKVRVVPLDNDAISTVEISGVVDKSDHYVFLVHYYNPDNSLVPVDVLFQNSIYGQANFDYCPSKSGCRTEIFDKRQAVVQNYFPVADKYTWTFYANKNQRGPLYIESITAVPVHTYHKSLLKHEPLQQSADFLRHCSADHLRNHPANVSDYCRQQVFSLTSEFNNGAVPCECNPKGAVDFCCEEYGGDCKCKPNIIGRTCDRCAPGFYNFPECKPCKCGDHMLCDETSGQCYCPNFVEGIECDRCVQYAFGYDRLIGCQLCGCNTEGSMNGESQCDAKNGQCLCKEGVGGRRCEKCLPGFYDFPHCKKCDCDVGGTAAAICDPTTSACLCKKNVIGPRCDTCKSGSFDLQPNHQQGCSECFCFGMTDKCQSSAYPIGRVMFPDEGWKTNDTAGSITSTSGEVVYEAGPESNSRNVYIEPPLGKKDFTSSYGLHMSFKLSSIPQDADKKKATSEADVRLVSEGKTLELWAREQPKDPAVPFEVVVTFSPDFWLMSSAEQVNRQTLMMVLHNLEKIQIKASYYEFPARAVLDQFSVEEAVQSRPTSYDLLAESVEVCRCPQGYAGFSCQECAPGFYRLRSEADNFLGVCVPCQCHGHSGSCDASTGVCLDCQHSTEGEHCERCVEGHHGNATTGSPNACLVCPCPRAVAGGNFATACMISDGFLKECVCRPGFTGQFCDQCAAGYFGRPRDGVPCKKCFCNDNNDLGAPDSCNPWTGECSNCEHNTDGQYCDVCAPWFYGDAMTKSCQNCTCNQCGTDVCDNTDGQCQCKPQVEGPNCDRCVENSWGFDSCRGCQPCECSTASSNSQCDLTTGQCSCMPGADGKRCETCQHGYWDYSSQGCKKCDCEADLSMGTVCNVQTGQCQCQEGATGPRCDTCVEGYLRIPVHGCRRCDECALALNSELDAYDLSVDVLRSTLNNVSTVVLTGAKLNRIQKAIGTLNPAIDYIAELFDGAVIDGLKDESANHKTAVEAFVFKANRFNDQLNNTLEKIQTYLNNLRELRKDTNDLIGTANHVLQEVQYLASELESATPVENQHELEKEAMILLDKIKEIHEKIVEHDVDKLKDVLIKPEIVVKVKESMNSRQEKVMDLQRKLTALNNISTIYTDEIQTVKSVTATAKALLTSLNLRNFDILLDGVNKDIKKKEEKKKGVVEKKATIKNDLAQLEKDVVAIADLKKELEEQKELLLAQVNENKRDKREANEDLLQKAKTKTDELVAKERNLSALYNNSISNVERHIEAATVYKRISNALKQASEKAEEAQKTANQAKEEVAKSKDSASSRLKSLNDAGNVLADKRSSFREYHKKLDELVARVDEQEKAADAVQSAVAKAQPPESAAQDLQAVTEKTEKANAKLNQFKDAADDFFRRTEETVKRANSVTNVFTNLSQSTDTARANLGLINENIPITLNTLNAVKQKVDKTMQSVDELKSKLAALKEKIAVVREKANQVKLAVHLEPSSRLELPIPQPNSELSAVTDAKTFFRTRRESGLLFYLGNEAVGRYTDFLAVEIDDQRPKLVGSLGREVFEVRIDEPVADYHWRQISVERTGKHIDFKLSKPNSRQTSSNASVTLQGQKNVFNLYDDTRHLFIGSPSEDVKLPAEVKSRDFDGDVDLFRLNGEHLGFWNSDNTEAVVGADTSSVPDEDSNEDGVSFNGRGYAQLSLGSWNPRKRTTLLLSFSSHAADGLLFYVGKNTDQLTIKLEHGQVVLSFDLGSGLVRLASNENHYNDGKWHLVQVTRNGRQAKLVVDNEDAVEGESPGTMFEMSVSDSIYLAGLPPTVESRFAVTPFRGCLKNLKLDNEYITMRHAKATKGMQKSCPNKEIRVVSLLSERSLLTLEKTDLPEQFELSFRFRTPASDGHLLEENVINFIVANESLVLWLNNEPVDSKLAFSSPFPNRWHYVHLLYKDGSVDVLLDDFIASSFSADLSDHLPSSEAVILVGKSGDRAPITGCFGDLMINNNIISLANGVPNEVQLTGCLIEESGVAEVAPTAEPAEFDADGLTTDATTPPPSSEPRPKPAKSNPRQPGSCALPLEPQGEREDIRGIRFGYNPGSRIEFNSLSESVKENIHISLELRANAANGVVLFATNEKHQDHLALYLLDGKVCLSYGASNARLIIQSADSILDDEWHEVRAEKEGASAILFVDGEQVANDRVENTEVLNVETPLFVGGVPKTLQSFIGRLLPGVKSEFGGCLRDLRINDEEFDEAKGESHGVVPCAQLHEEGVFFGRDGGYAMVPEFVANKQFYFELEVKPRLKTAVILSVGVIDYVTIQLVNGSVKLTVDDGAGPMSVLYTPPLGSSICDGNWHKIKALRKKAIVTLNVDSKSNLMVIKKKGPTDSSLRDPLYFGGVPKDRRLKGLDTVDSYVGCMRIINARAEPKRRKRDVDLTRMVLFGNLDRSQCPLN